MLVDSHNFSAAIRPFSQNLPHNPILNIGDAAKIDSLPIFAKSGEKASLVVTSPPYAGVHILYHRWQVDGRKETPAPYWISSCNDGQGASYYSFGNRQQPGLHGYFENAFNAFSGIRKVMKQGGNMVQLVAFNNPTVYLPRYLDMMEQAGFKETYILPRRSNGAKQRVWRHVPNRKWHAHGKGKTKSAREVALIHRAV